MTGPASPRSRVWRIFLAEDHPGVIRGFHLLLGFEPDLEVCGEAATPEEAFAGIQALRPDLAIVDLTLKGGSGLELIVRLHLECPRVRVLVVSMHDQSRWIELAFQAGAHGYLTKEESADHLARAIREVLDGKQFLSGRVLARLGRKSGADRLRHPRTDSTGGSNVDPLAIPEPKPSAPPDRPSPPRPRHGS